MLDTSFLGPVAPPGFPLSPHHPHHQNRWFWWEPFASTQLFLVRRLPVSESGPLCALVSLPDDLASARRSIKRYFLMDQGDFFVHFMDLTEEELKKPVDDITPTRLEALLELALRMSTANTDPFKDDLKVGWG